MRLAETLLHATQLCLSTHWSLSLLHTSRFNCGTMGLSTYHKLQHVQLWIFSQCLANWLGICIFPFHFERSRGFDIHCATVMGTVKWWGSGGEQLRGQETFYKCLCCGPRCKFPDSPCSLLKVKLGRKKGVVQPHWMMGQSRQFLTSVCYFWMRIRIFCQAHLADFLSLRCDWKKWKPQVLKRALGQLGAICIYPTVHWSRSSDSQHLRTCAVSRWGPLVPTPAEGKKPPVLIIQSPIQFIYGIVSGPKLWADPSVNEGWWTWSGLLRRQA